MRCKALREDGTVCGLSFDDMPYFTFRDSHGMKLKNYDTNEFGICQNHYQKIIGKLIDKEQGYIDLLKQLRRKRSAYYKLSAIERNQISKKVTENNEKIKHFEEILYDEQHKKCRFCKHPLNDVGCIQCEKRQTVGVKKYSYIGTFNSDNTPRKTHLNMHTICGRIFMQQLFGFNLLPTANSGQYTIEDSLEIPKIVK